MGLIGGALETVFGDGRNPIAETAQVFRVNADASDERAAAAQAAALAQFAAEFGAPGRSLFDRVIDGLNRLPRPAMAFGTLGLLGAAMVNPVWFASRMQGLALVPEPLWWLLGAIVSFYFGARHQAKGQEFQRALAVSLARMPMGASDGAGWRGQGAGTDANPALDAWRAGGGTMGAG
ncbi:holin family protein [Rhodovulum adriaticum]|uniref:Holin (3TMs family) n=1 Tax=Rhodovulum adriaticum TaxID=35804 RepID=A0A4R2NTQ0_RHOAD|nr:holin family protein [Rhodovulum adriaticum]MBK1635036.1 carboxylesterase [Rhodovulum adriaticum]TCP25330.1 holin (3TMs family) [Rhodovulum adriaticum]